MPPTLTDVAFLVVQLTVTLTKLLVPVSQRTTAGVATADVNSGTSDGAVVAVGGTVVAVFVGGLVGVAPPADSALPAGVLEPMVAGGVVTVVAVEVDATFL